MEQRELREEVAVAGRVLERAGLGDLIWGHVSARDPQARGAWLKASGLGFDEVTAPFVQLVDERGDVLVGEGRRHVEHPIHTQVYLARGDVGAVVHAHPTQALAFASTEAALRPISHDGCLLVPPDLARFTGTADLIRTPELGAALAASLGQRNAVLIPHHGIVTVGPDLATAVMTAVLLERACRLQLLATAAGGPATWSSDAEAQAKRSSCWPPAQVAAGYAHLARAVGR